MLRRKADARSCLKAFVTLVENQFDTKIKIIHGDNGLEFSIPDFYVAKGIIHQRTCVETPEQIGIVERKINTSYGQLDLLGFNPALP